MCNKNHIVYIYQQAKKKFLTFVLEMYRKGIISLGKATEILDVTKWEMPGIPKDRGIPLNYDVEELEEDRKTWKMLEE